MAAVTALLYSAGFIAMQTHLNLLDISRAINVPSREYLIVGAQFFIYLPFFMTIGLLLCSPVLVILIIISKRNLLQPWAIIPFILVLSLGLLFVWVLQLLQPFGLLLNKSTNALGLIFDLIHQGKEGRKWLLLTYSMNVVIVALFLFFGIRCWYWNLRSHLLHLLRLALLVALLIYILFLPINYGFMVIPIKYPRVTFQVKGDEAPRTVEGWMFNRNPSRADEHLVLYTMNPSSGSTGELLMIQKSLIKTIRITGNDFIFPLGKTHKHGDKP